LSGEIPRVTPFERGLPAHYQKPEEGRWMPDPLVIDERFLMVNVAGKGLIVFTACSHAGLVNVLKHAGDSSPGVPLYAVVGGFHLAGPNEKIIPETVQAVREFNLNTIAAGHCTGWRAVKAFADAVGETVVDPSVVGKRYTF
jgi:7,8-dihydropterin-6-yl-methyl-4-(beta-D-ribofuranosyl)aminobenzene 5'-phosphate synthase